MAQVTPAREKQIKKRVFYLLFRSLIRNFAISMVEQLDLFSDFDLEQTPECPIIGREVVLAGDFPQGRQAMRSTLLKLGASKVRYDRPSRTTHVIVVGENAPAETINYAKLYRHDGYNIQLLTIVDIQRIKDGDYASYHIPEQIVKNLHVSAETVWWQMPEIANLKTQRAASPIDLRSAPAPLYGKEIFLHESIFDSMPSLYQEIGNRGGYANVTIDDDTDAIVIPRSLPKEICQAVEDYYNRSKSVSFNVPFIILEELTEYLSIQNPEYGTAKTETGSDTVQTR